MEKINKFLLMVIAMMVIMVAAVGIDKGLKQIEAQKWEKERVARYEQARAEVNDMQLTISELSRIRRQLGPLLRKIRHILMRKIFGLNLKKSCFLMRMGKWMCLEMRE